MASFGNYIDSYFHKGLRKKLLDEVEQMGINDPNVLQAMDKVPRHFFMDTAFERIAYENRAFPIAAGQTISQPYTVAYQSQLLEVKPFEKILEVGTGSAYQACILAELGAMVYSIERKRELYDLNNKFYYLKRFPKLKRFYGDGFKGLPSYAPFDKMIITAAAPFVPDALIEQLKIGGFIIAPVDEEDGEGQIMKKIIKTEDGIQEEVFDKFSFVPMLKGKD
ncbi:MAG TPA: protein-L-isoaspartate(D-aspartate) O-methyltransferase [Chitinophagaceae bacterium]|nr:protein-L-isoaspartate(D-aspartate) O-methyltransferase [Chitinophagaceae bacterium]